MTDEWMIDVLVDLRKFAEKKAMLELAEHLDDAIFEAAIEIRNRGGVVSIGINDAKTGNIPGTVGNNQYS